MTLPYGRQESVQTVQFFFSTTTQFDTAQCTAHSSVRHSAFNITAVFSAYEQLSGAEPQAMADAHDSEDNQVRELCWSK